MRVFLMFFLLLFSVSSWAITDNSIELQVEKMPIVKSKADLSKLVKKLTSQLKGDKEKAYALLVWIVKNIDYDDYKMRQIDKNNSSHLSHKEVPTGQDILETRLGVCEDIAKLYDKMLKLADMNSVVLKGCSGNKMIVSKMADKCVGESHAWNAVWIDKQWELVDPTWAIIGGEKKVLEDVDSKFTYNRELKKRTRYNSKIYQPRTERHVDSKWFMTDPQVMKKDHYPTKPNSRWLLTSSKDRKNPKLK